MNARSLKNKLSNFHELLSSNEFQLIIVTETWLNPCILDSVLTSSTSYVAARCDRPDGYGGVAVFFKDNICVTIQANEATKFMNFLCLNVHIVKISNASLYRLLVFYTPPPVLLETVKEIQVQIESFMKTDIPTVICGDFNLPNRNWSIPCCCGRDSAHEPFLRVIHQNNFVHLVQDPTRENSILDLVLTNYPEKILDLNVTAPFHVNCDHASIHFSLLVSHYAPRSSNQFVRYVILVLISAI